MPSSDLCSTDLCVSVCDRERDRERERKGQLESEKVLALSHSLSVWVFEKALQECVCVHERERSSWTRNDEKKSFHVDSSVRR